MRLKSTLTDETYKASYGVDAYGEDVIFESLFNKFIACRGDWGVLQLLLKSDEDFYLNVGKRPNFSPKGPLTNIRVECTVDGLPVKIFPVGFIEDDDRVYKADLLLHDEVIFVEKDKIQPVWIEVMIPKDTPPGNYTGRVKIYTQCMFEDEELIKVFDFNILVKDVELPEPKNFRFYLDLWQHLSNIARKHEVHLWSDEHFRVLEGYVKSLADLGQKAITVIASEIPWSGQRCYRVKNYPSDLFEYSMIRVERDGFGYHYDFSVVERYIDLCMKYGIDKEIEVFGLMNIWLDPEYGYTGIAEDYPDGIRIRYYDRNDGAFKYIRNGEEIKAYIKALEKFFIEKDLIDRVRIVADEPGDIGRYKRSLETIREVAPGFRFKSAINHSEFIEEFKNIISDFVPVLPGVCEKWETLKELKSKVTGRILWYVCCWPPYPNTFISSPLVESRLIGILTAFMGLDGFLRWNYTVWPEDPRNRISYRFPHWKAGDTNFVYPGKDGRPILTLRYKNLKRGIEDYELLMMFKEKYGEKTLESLWDKILKTRDIREFHISSGKSPNELYSLDGRDYYGFRSALLEALEEK
jgi:hypothetical protein